MAAFSRTAKHGSTKATSRMAKKNGFVAESSEPAERKSEKRGTKCNKEAGIAKADSRVAEATDGAVD